MASVETIVYREVDGVEIRANVHCATTSGAGAAVLFFHGGALIMGDRTWVPPALVSQLTEAGISVVSVDYRLAPETKLPEIVSDIEAAYRWLRTTGASQFSFDPDRVAVAGGSAGGYLALLAGSTFRPPPAAVVSFYGYGDITGPWYTAPDPFYTRTNEAVTEDRARSVLSGEPISQGPRSPSNDRYDFYLYCRQQGTWPVEVCGQVPTDTVWFGPYEPVRNVTQNHPPTMLLHGEADTDVPIEQSLLMADEFKKHAVPHRLMTDPEWGHAFDLIPGAPRVADAIDAVVAFLVKHLAEAQ